MVFRYQAFQGSIGLCPLHGLSESIAICVVGIVAYIAKRVDLSCEIPICVIAKRRDPASRISPCGRQALGVKRVGTYIAQRILGA